MAEFDFETQKATPEWLTFVLHENGFLVNGDVTSVNQRTVDLPGTASSFLELDIKYSKWIDHLPSRILMKIAISDLFYLADNEIDFYKVAINSNTSLPLATCYGFEKQTNRKLGCILLEDLTKTHHQLKWTATPHLEQCKDIVKALIKVHSFGWNNSVLTDHMMDMRSEEAWQIYIRQVENLFSDFASSLAGRLSKKMEKTYLEVFEKLPSLIWSRYSSSKHHTLVHNDVNFGNVLFPNKKNGNQCTIIDWQFWNIGLGVKDLACFIALNLPSEPRQRMEQPLLQFYFDEMKTLQIDYSWEEFQTDYRIFILFHLLPPVLWKASNVAEDYLWLVLERLFVAIDDINCLELL